MNKNSSKKILINRTDALGDTLLSFPVGMYIKNREPNSEVTFLISSRFGDLAKVIKGDIKFVTYDAQKGSFFEKFSFFSKLFKKLKPTHFFQMGGQTYPLGFAWLKFIPFRGGLKSRIATFLFMNKGVRQQRRMVLKHETTYNLELLSTLYKDLDVSKIEFNSILPKFDFSELEFDNAILPQKPFMVIHPGMTGHSLNWPMEYYAEFMAKWDEKYNGSYDYVISFTPSDKRYVDGLKEALKKYNLKGLVHDYDGSKLGLANYAKFISHASFFLGPSTGTTHLAGLIGIKTVGIYSPIRVQRKERWGILGVNARSISPAIIGIEEAQGEEAISAMAKISIDSVILTLEQI
jgi:heptosyltransferase-3